MIDLRLLKEELRKHEEVKQITPRELYGRIDGIEVTIRSKIIYYDLDAVDGYIRVHPESEPILSKLSEYEQEHKYFVTSEFCHRINSNHSPVGAFCDPFESTQCAGELCAALFHEQYSMIADLLIADTACIRVDDGIIMQYFLRWAKNLSYNE